MSNTETKNQTEGRRGRRSLTPCSPLKWKRGPAQKEFDPNEDFWGDGERILIVVEYRDGEQAFLVDTSCDEHFSVLNLTDGTGDDSGVCDHEVKWWAAINPDQWPSKENSQDQQP